MEITTIEPFLAYWRRVRERTLRVGTCVPAERFEEPHRPGGFSQGDILRHLATIERWMFVENALLRPSLYPGHGRELADGPAATLALVERLHAESLSLLASLTPAGLLARTRTPGGAEIPVWKWLRAMVEHECHHRGQLYLVLGLWGVPTPPLYGLTEEEVHARSLQPVGQVEPDAS
jgi:uncharacterized damage-inducible protein DinB